MKLSVQDCEGLIQEAYLLFLPQGSSGASISADTRLFGGDSILDSTALVSLLIEIEQQLNDTHHVEIVIADDRAMSQKRSPFRTIGSLAEYLAVLVAEKSEHS
ncbi:MAG: hypothetical protein HYX27_06185 [Acidobacteria bacterium]|nr:hypothetical protein [Acidobacteriota bacterium]